MQGWEGEYYSICGELDFGATLSLWFPSKNPTGSKRALTFVKKYRFDI
jgi:hypothetical protein